MSFGDDPLPETAPLTEEEIRSLRPGDRVVVLWRGGGGPFEYDITLRGKAVFASIGKHLIDDLLRAWSLNKVWKIEKAETK